jgi:MFS family permease
LPLRLFKNHTFALTSALGGVIGAGMFGAIVMLPLICNVVKGDTATAAGLKLIPFMLGIVSMSIFSGKQITKHGHYKKYPIMGTAAMTIGILLMATLQQNTPFWRLSIFAIIIGAGLGLSMQTIAYRATELSLISARTWAYRQVPTPSSGHSVRSLVLQCSAPASSRQSSYPLLTRPDFRRTCLPRIAEALEGFDPDKLKSDLY